MFVASNNEAKTVRFITEYIYRKKYINCKIVAVNNDNSFINHHILTSPPDSIPQMIIFHPFLLHVEVQHRTNTIRT